jgi:hypothetical protein
MPAERPKGTQQDYRKWHVSIEDRENKKIVVVEWK